MKKLLAILLCLGLCGCASFYASRYPNDDYPATSPESIPVYNNYPPVPYEIIGEVGGNGAPLSSWQGMGKRLREYAAQMGGDAVVIAEQATPYEGTYTTPTTVSTTSSAYGTANTTWSGSAQVYGNNIYGQASGNTYGQAYGQSYTTINPGTSTPMYGKEVKAYVIKYTNSDSIATSTTPVTRATSGGTQVNDEKYGYINKDEQFYISKHNDFNKTAKIFTSRVFQGYEKTKRYYDLVANGQAQEADKMRAEIISDMNKAVAAFADNNQIKIIYDALGDEELFKNEEDISDKIISILNDKQAQVVESDKTSNIISGDTLEDKLKTLNKLLTDGLITKDDFDAKKKALLDNYTSK